MPGADCPLIRPGARLPLSFHCFLAETEKGKITGPTIALLQFWKAIGVKGNISRRPRVTMQSYLDSWTMETKAPGPQAACTVST